jgi:hypothetical protein
MALTVLVSGESGRPQGPQGTGQLAPIFSFEPSKACFSPGCPPQWSRNHPPSSTPRLADLLPPTLNFFSDGPVVLLATAAPGEASATVQFPLMDARDNLPPLAGGFKVECTAPLGDKGAPKAVESADGDGKGGSAFPVGVTLVTCKTKDAIGKESAGLTFAVDVGCEEGYAFDAVVKACAGGVDGLLPCRQGAGLSQEHRWRAVADWQLVPGPLSSRAPHSSLISQHVRTFPCGWQVLTRITC